MIIAAVILAAGESSRLGMAKQLLQLEGKTLVRRAVEVASESGCSPIVVVVGAEAEPIVPELKSTDAIIVQNDHWKSGIGSSIRRGVTWLVDQRLDPDAIVLLVCDQPFVDVPVVNQLIALHQKTMKPIVAARYGNTVGVPALFGRTYFDKLLTLDDSSGAKSVILSHRDEVAELPFVKGEVDIDTADDWRNLTADKVSID